MKHLSTITLPLVGLGLLLQSCVYDISYRLTETDKWTPTMIPQTVRVETFKDNAPKDEKINIAIGGETWRVNGREGYQDGEIAEGVSKMVAKHLKHSGVFEDVYAPNEPGQPDLILGGEIYDYNAMGRAHMGAETMVVLGSAMGSIPGAALTGVATLPFKTDVVSTVELRNVELREAATGRAVWYEESIRRSERERRHFIQADAPHVYKRADQQLKTVVGDMVTSLGSSQLAIAMPQDSSGNVMLAAHSTAPQVQIRSTETKGAEARPPAQPARRSVAMSRTLLTTKIAVASAPTGTAHSQAKPGTDPS